MQSLTGTAQVTVFRDVQDPGGNREIKPHPVPPGTTVGDLVDRVRGDAGYVSAYHNGVKADLAEVVHPGDWLTVAAFPEDPISLAVGSVVATAYASAAAAAVWSVISSPFFIASAIAASLSAAASLLVDEPRTPGQGPSPTYGRAGMASSQAEGSPIAVTFGRMKVPGQVIFQRVHHIAGNAQRYGSHSVTRGNLRQLTIAALGESLHSIGGQTSDITTAWFSEVSGAGTTFWPKLKLPPVKTDPYVGIRDTSSRQRVAFLCPHPLNLTGDIIVSLVRLVLFRIGDLAGYKVRVTAQSNQAILALPDGVDIFTPIEMDANNVFKATSAANGYLASVPFAFDIPDIAIKPPGAPSWFWIVVDGDWPVSASNYIGLMLHRFLHLQARIAHWNGGTWTGILNTMANAEVIGNPDQWTGTGVKINGNDLANFTQSGSITTRRGTSGQLPIPGPNEVTRQTPVGAALTRNKMLTASTNDEVDAVSLLVTFPHGWHGSGKLHAKTNAPFDVDIGVRAQGQTGPGYPVSFTHKEAPFIASPGHTILILVEFPINSKSPYGQLNGQKVEIMMKRVGQPGVTQMDAEWTLIQEISDEQAQTHPLTAMVAIDSDVATQGGVLQTVTAVVEGQEAWVFSNGGATRVWQYTTNYAWCCLKWLLNQRFGSGNKLTLGNIDIDSFIEWADFCDELIDDGSGKNTTMKRHECGLNIDTDKAQWEWAKTFSAASRTKLLRVGNTIRAKPEKPATTTTQLFTMGNIIEGSFQIEFFGVRKRPNHVYVDFLDEELDFDWNSAPDDAEGMRPDDPSLVEHVEILGLTNLQRAMNLARFYTNLMKSLTTAIQFEASMDAVAVEPGDVFAFSHDMPWENQASGRVPEDAPSGTTITFDREITIESDKTYKVTVRTAGTGQLLTQERTISHAAGTYDAGTSIGITPSWDGGDLPLGPDPSTGRGGDPYAFGEEAGTTKHVYLYEAVTVEFTQAKTKRIRAINYDATIFDTDPGPLPPAHIYPRPVPKYTPDSVPPAPRNLRLGKIPLGPFGQYSAGTTTLQAIWERATWYWPYTAKVWIRDDTASEIQYEEAGETKTNAFIFEKALTVGHTYTVAVTPMAPGSGQYHNANSKYAARATLTLEWAAVAPTVVIGF